MHQRINKFIVVGIYVYQGRHGWQGPQGLGLAWILQNNVCYAEKLIKRSTILLGLVMFLRNRCQEVAVCQCCGSSACKKLPVAALYMYYILEGKKK